MEYSYILVVTMTNNEQPKTNFWKSRRPLGEIFLLLAILWGGLGWYATWDTPLSFEVEIKQSNIKDYIADTTGTANSLDTNALAATDNTGLSTTSGMETTTPRDNTMPAPPPPLTDTSSLYILLCGDSMTEGLMPAFNKYAQFNGHKLKTRTWYSSRTLDWGKSDTLSGFIRMYRPSLIIFTLGSNELFIKNPQEREEYIKNIVRQADAAGVPFVWIGPPNWKEDTGIGDIMQKAVGEDRYFLSKNLKFQRGKDGAHPVRESSAVWADTISSWLMRTSRFKGKILLRNPKQYPGVADRPYIPATNDSLLLAAREHTAWKVVAPKPTATTTPVKPTKPTTPKDTTKKTTAVITKTDSAITNSPKDSTDK